MMLKKERYIDISQEVYETKIDITSENVMSGEQTQI